MATSEPVLLIAFNRPDHLGKVIDRLRAEQADAIRAGQRVAQGMAR